MHISEDFIQYLWQFQQFTSVALQTVDGLTLQVINPGIKNRDSGPDFLHAKVIIDGTTWAGHVEIHLNASDWEKHKHHSNQEYKNVILHVVYNNDKPVFYANGTKIPTLEIKQFIPVKIQAYYQKFLDSNQAIVCSDKIKSIDNIIKEQWLERICIERLEQKSKETLKLLEANKWSWEESFYIQIARNFGFKVNAEAFEMLAKSLPLKILAKHKNDLLHIEALLLGQAGFLNQEAADEYTKSLQANYNYLKQKYSLTQPAYLPWHLLRLRPANFPSLRIAQFAALICHSSGLLSKIMDAKTYDEISSYFSHIKPSDYWQEHYQLGKKSNVKQVMMGKASIDNIIINTIIPMMFNYGEVKNLPQLKDRAVELYYAIKPEKNNIIKQWVETGFVPQNAGQSQALLHLYKFYCQKKRCLQCQFGTTILNRAMA